VRLGIFARFLEKETLRENTQRPSSVFSCTAFEEKKFAEFLFAFFACQVWSVFDMYVKIVCGIRKIVVRGISCGGDSDSGHNVVVFQLMEMDLGFSSYCIRYREFV
jgi:hypothetical protein